MVAMMKRVSKLNIDFMSVLRIASSVDYIGKQQKFVKKKKIGISDISKYPKLFIPALRVDAQEVLSSGFRNTPEVTDCSALPDTCQAYFGARPLQDWVSLHTWR